MGRTMSKATLEIDPLSIAVAPPKDEGPEARAARQQKEALAKKRSEEIDALIAAESNAKRKRGKCIKLLLLGQSESGKSTTLKNFQLTYARKAWAAEKEAWKAVIQFNLIRSVNTIVDALSQQLEVGHDVDGLLPPAEDFPDDDGVSIIYPTRRPAPKSEFVDVDATGRPATAMSLLGLGVTLTDKHNGLVERLAPLKAAQAELENRLGSGAEEEEQTSDNEATSALKEASSGGAQHHNPQEDNSIISTVVETPHVHEEFFVRSFGWKSALQRLRPRGSTRGSMDGSADVGVDGVTRTLARMSSDIQALWTDTAVKEVVRARKIRLMDCSEFYLSNASRIASTKYAPSDDDVVRARLRTIGVQEHRMVLESGPDPGREWLIFDVGGSRTSRAAWPAYFDDVDAILFLAPVSGFDERLREDRRVNRLDDSLQLWKIVCGHRLLKDTELVLFLNKTDVLEKKLADGAKFNSYVRSYEGPNIADEIVKFLRTKFTDVCRHYSKEPRGLHIHFTSVIDTKATAKTLAAVQDGILRRNLQNLALI